MQGDNCICFSLHCFVSILFVNMFMVDFKMELREVLERYRHKGWD